MTLPWHPCECSSPQRTLEDSLQQWISCQCSIESVPPSGTVSFSKSCSHLSIQTGRLHFSLCQSQSLFCTGMLRALVAQTLATHCRLCTEPLIPALVPCGKKKTFTSYSYLQLSFFVFLRVWPGHQSGVKKLRPWLSIIPDIPQEKLDRIPSFQNS